MKPQNVSYKNIVWFRINLIVRLNLLKFEMTKSTAMLQLMVVFRKENKKCMGRTTNIHSSVNTIAVSEITYMLIINLSRGDR